MCHAIGCPFRETAEAFTWRYVAPARDAPIACPSPSVPEPITSMNYIDFAGRLDNPLPRFGPGLSLSINLEELRRR
jgi:hypothetical protein